MASDGFVRLRLTPCAGTGERAWSFRSSLRGASTPVLIGSFSGSTGFGLLLTGAGLGFFGTL